MAVKIFEDLEKEVVNRDLCNLCGACLAVCTSNEIKALSIEDGKPRYIDASKDLSKCLDCGICYLVCGQTAELNTEIDDLYSVKPPIGSYKYLTSARTTNPEIQQVAQDGGVVTSILKYLLERNLIDGAIVNQPTGDWVSKPQIITSIQELIQSAGTRYSTIPSVQELGNYKILDKDEPRLAFVGCPCQIQTIRKMQVMKARPGIFVKYLIGLFCMENFNYDTLIKGKIEKELKIDLSKVKKLNIKGNFFITLKDNSQIEIPLKDLSHLVRNNCHYCIDFTNHYADISIGGIGSPTGYSTVLIRTETGNALFSNMLIEKEIEEVDSESLDIKEIKAKILSLISRLGQIKYDRGTKNKAKL
ncbi:MAG: Coenzyme F420 hydrogenase/dehydrogenase, beta subunit C-terminal domain [Candidatus Helarchaeota archaeon]|nr:Coenzyme F420 hydrogenase/dehydrogenase, beta subunit C-terminal domain [Candidatus Helarchaeota archaeon]